MAEIKDAKLRDLNVRAERAQACFEEGEKELFRPDGSKLFSDSEHGERVRALEQERNGVLRDIEQQAKEVRMAVATEIERIENADPADALAPSELEQANLKRVFYQSAFASLRSSPESRTFYDRKRREGKRHTQSLIALARRRVNVVWAMLRDGTTFQKSPSAA